MATQLEQLYANGGLRAIETMFAANHPNLFSRASSAAWVGDFDTALDLLEGAFENRTAGIINLRNSADFDGMREHPRYRELVRKMRYPD